MSHLFIMWRKKIASKTSDELISLKNVETNVARYPSPTIEGEYGCDKSLVFNQENNEYGEDYDSGYNSTVVGLLTASDSDRNLKTNDERYSSPTIEMSNIAPIRKVETNVARYPSPSIEGESSCEKLITSDKETNEYGTDYDSGAYSTFIASVHNKDVQVSITMYEDLASESVPDSSGNNNISNETQVMNTFFSV